MKKLPLIIITILGIAFVLAFYGKIILHPNEYMFSDSGDGIKNYFTYSYHIKYDSSYTNFEGMNYPYGENYLYTDCHPILANTFKWLSSISPFFTIHSVGLLNLLMIFSIFISFIILYLLLVDLKFNKWMSVIFSFSIVLLAPQIFRLGGHLALSYSVAIPLSWLLIIKYFQSFRNQYIILLIINNLFWLFIHAYLGMIVLAFVFSLLSLEIVTDKQKRKSLYSYFHFGMIVFLPILMFYAYSIITDTHVGRTNNPSGFFLYNAEFDDVLLPHGKPFRPLLDQLTANIINLKWEARGYIGMVNSLFFIALICITILSVFRKKTRKLLSNLFDNKLLNLSLMAAFIVLLFAFAIPFKQFPKLLEVMPVFKQFRATGRFVWPFYFVFTAFAAYNFQKLFFNLREHKRLLIGIGFMVIVIGITSLEAYYYHQEVSKRISKSANLFNRDLLPADLSMGIDQVTTIDYQAIIAFPFYYQGSESFSRPRIDEAVRKSMIISYHTGLPLVCANLTRTSVQESKRIVQMVSPNYYDKEIIKDLKSKKPFLIVTIGNHFTKYERAIIEKGKSIFKKGEMELLQLDFEDLFSDDSKRVIKEFHENLPQLILQDSFYVSSPSSILYYNGFENNKSDTTFRGQGAYVSQKNGKNVFTEFPAHTFGSGKEYDLSVWMYNGGQDAINLYFRLIVEEYDDKDNQWYTTTFFPDKAETIYGDWTLVEGVFKIKDANNKVYIVSKSGEYSQASLYVDDILIKDKDIDVYRVEKEKGFLFFNNHHISLK